jgi:hypothetical protein
MDNKPQIQNFTIVRSYLIYGAIFFETFLKRSGQTFFFLSFFTSEAVSESL